MKQITILEYFESTIFQLGSSDTIFGRLAEYGAPWAPEEEPEYYRQAFDLDNEYILRHSGSKLCSPYLIRLLPFDIEACIGVICKALLNRYRDKWTRLWQTEVLDYSPISNYDMTETYGELSREHGYNSESNSGSEASQTDTTYGKTETVTHGLTNDVDEYTYGINNTDDDGKHSSRVAEAQGGTTGTSNTGVDTVGVGSNWSENKGLQRDMSTDKNYTLRRQGNIGVTTSQQMIQAEREVRKWLYFETVFNDIDEVLTVPFYDMCKPVYDISDIFEEE